MAVPVVDLAPLLQAKGEGGDAAMVTVIQSQPAVKDVANKVYQALCQFGFCYFSNHGLPQSDLDSVISVSKQFFEMDLEVKQKYARGTNTNHGWVGLERERLNENRPHADLKEAFNYSPHDELGWPTEVPDMGPSFQAFFQSCHELSNHILDLMGVALELKNPSLLTESHRLAGKKGSYTSLRSLYYPLCTHLKEGQIQCGEHSDYGSITLLFQDDTGGLQILGKDGQYLDVRPVAGAVLVIVGDLIQRWTTDKFPATKHRVIVPAEAVKAGRARQSLAFFCQPDNDTLVSCLDGSDTYPPITSYDYLMSRYSATY